MNCKRCNSEDVEIKSLHPIVRVFAFITGISTIIGSDLNIILLILGLGCIGASFTDRKNVHCNTCGAKY